MVLEEHIFLVEYVFQEGTDLVHEQFAEKFPETHIPHHSVLRTVIEKFREIGSVLDAERSRPSKLNDKKLMDISDSMLRSAFISAQ
jgi:hypothetical protein